MSSNGETELTILMDKTVELIESLIEQVNTHQELLAAMAKDIGWKVTEDDEGLHFNKEDK